MGNKIGTLWIESPWAENPVFSCVRHTEPLDSCFDLIRSHLMFIPWSLRWRTNQRPQNAEPKLYHLAFGSHHTQAMPNQLVMAIVRPINLNMSCKLFPYTLQRSMLPPGPRLPNRIGNTRPCNYYNNLASLVCDVDQ